MNYYPRHVGDYIRDTSHLTLLEHGVYTRLLDVYYTREAPIPADQANRLVGARTKEEKEAVASVLAEFFTLSDDAWHNKRCDQELEKHREFLANQRRKGQASGNARRLRSGSTGSEPETNSGSTGDEQRFNSGSTGSEPEGNLPSPSSHLPSPKPKSLSQQSDRSYSDSGGARASESAARETFLAIQDRYPAGIYRKADWLLAERQIGRLLDEGEPPSDLVSAAVDYAAQQTAKGSVGTQFVLSPSKFYTDGAWRGPFPIPAAQQAAKPESDYDRMIRLNGGRPTEKREVIEHEAIPIRLEG